MIRWDGRPDNVQGHSFLSGLKAPGNLFFWVLVGSMVIVFLDWKELKEKYGIRFPNLWVSDGLEVLTQDKGTRVNILPPFKAHTLLPYPGNHC